jgi:hypothetical protein
LDPGCEHYSVREGQAGGMVVWNVAR